MIIIVGCPRSGTQFISLLFKEHGFDVAHECWGRDGASWWQLTGREDFWRNFNTCPPELRCCHPAVHQVRHPLVTIASLTTIADVSWQWIGQSTPVRLDQPVLRRGMLAYIHWNRLAERRAAFTYRVEDIANVFNELCMRAGFKTVLKPDFKTSPRANWRYHAEVTWADLEREDGALAQEVRREAVRYGYIL